MINNKGFAVSAVLYTLLIAFLMFLGAALAQFETSSGILGKANDDLVNGTKFEIMQVKPAGYVSYFDTSNKKITLNSGNSEKKINCVRVNSVRTELDLRNYNSANSNNLSYTKYQDRYWYETDTIVRVKSRYGTKYWPKDFAGASITQSDSSFSVEPGSANGKIEVKTIEGNNLGLKFIDGATNVEKTITLYDICE